jgi:hypothetical protein
MLLSVSMTQSTLYDQIRYSGSPSAFAWVLPIHGTVDVGLSADVLFNSIDEVTATQIVAPPQNCPSCGGRGGGCDLPIPGGSSNSAGSASLDQSTTPPPPVIVTRQENVGPYDTVQLHATDSSALENWLAQNGFVIPTDVMPVIAAYLAEGFDFLAMKLLPNVGVQAMRPVRVTTPGGGLSLPMRMASIGTGVRVGITVWVVADGRYEPQNYPFYTIDTSALVWDWKTSSSNYTTLRALDDALLQNAGWEIESSVTVSEQTITNVILGGGQYSGPGIGQGAPVDATQDYLPVGTLSGGSDAGSDSGDSGASYQSADDVRTADIATLLAGLAGPNVRITRIRSDIAHAAMTKDFVLQASADQAELSNVRYVQASVNLQCPPCQNSSGCATSSSARVGEFATTAVGVLLVLWGLVASRLRRN